MKVRFFDLSKKSIISYRALILLQLLTVGINAASAQTPIANRVRALADNMPPECTIVAKYTDKNRHCLYYSLNNRLYRHNVLNDKSNEVRFANDGYAKLLKTFIVHKGKFIYITVTKELQPKGLDKNNTELWQINTLDLSSKKISKGIDIKKRKGCFIVTKVTRQTIVDNKEKWFVKDHYYDLNGKVIWAKDEYEYKQE